MSPIHRAFVVPDIKALDLREEPFGLSTQLVTRVNPLADRALFKCSDTSPCEVFGYLLAQLLQVPTPRFRAVHLPNETHVPGGYEAASNHLAILVELVPSLCHIQLSDIARQDPPLAARILTLCLFDRYEWPEITSSGALSLVVDLERIGPVMCLDEFTTGPVDTIRDVLTNRKNEYADSTCSAIQTTIGEAHKLAVWKEFEGQLSALSRFDRTTLFRGLRIEGHPFADRLSSFFHACVSGRESAIAGRLGYPAWPSIDWLSAIKKTSLDGDEASGGAQPSL